LNKGFEKAVELMPEKIRRQRVEVIILSVVTLLGGLLWVFGRK
jgi:hypothetical protein